MAKKISGYDRENLALREMDAERSIRYYIYRLNYLSRMLWIFGMISAAMTVVNVTILFAFVGGVLDLHPRLIVLATVGTLLALLMVLIMYDVFRRRGSGIFEELSDTLQFLSYGTSKDPSSTYPEEEEKLSHIMIEARFVMREFSSSSNLPLIPGQYGPSIFFLINLLISLSMVFVHAHLFF